MAATIKDIARRLNISISTVSYALNDGPRPVPAEVRDRVLAVARELEYRPNQLARAMATGRADTIAVVPPRDAHPLLVSPYLQAVLTHIIEAAEELGQDILLRTTGDSDSDTLNRTVLSGKADGLLLIAPHQGSQLAAEAARQAFPCVVFSADAPPGAVSVSMDNDAATRTALDYLLSLGHRRIGHLTGRDGLRDSNLRQRAFREIMTANHLPLREEWIQPGDFMYQRGREAAERILRLPDRPTALLAANDESGIGAMDAALALGLRVPEDVSIMGFDCLPQEIFASRRLTSMRQPLRDMARESIRLLAQWAQEELEPPAPRKFPAELVVQATTAVVCSS